MVVAFGSHINKHIVLCGVFLGLFQGIVWTILSFIGIIWHSTVDTEQESDTSYNGWLSKYFYYTFIKKSGYETTLFHVRPNTFSATMFIYFFLSLIWAATSAAIFVGLRKKLRTNFICIALIAWAITSAATVILDAIFGILLASDYKTVKQVFDETTDVGLKSLYAYCVLVYGIAFVLAFRGFVLWIINLALTVAAIRICVNLKLNPPNEQRFGTLNSSKSFLFGDDLLYSTPKRLQRTGSLPPGRSVLDAYDPEVEERFRRYEMSPKPWEQ